MLGPSGCRRDVRAGPARFEKGGLSVLRLVQASGQRTLVAARAGGKGEPARRAGRERHDGGRPYESLPGSRRCAMYIGEYPRLSQSVVLHHRMVMPGQFARSNMNSHKSR